MPSSDYYAKGNDWQTEYINSLRPLNFFDTLVEAEKDLEDYLNEQTTNHKDEYTILPIYSKL